MKKSVKRGLRIAYCIIGLLLFTLTGLYICRDQLLHYMADKKISEMETDYGLNIHYNKLKFNGISEVELDNFSIVPQQRDTLLNLESMKVKLHLFPLLFGNIEVKDMSLKRLALTFIKRDSISNYDFLFRKDKNDSTNVNKKNDYSTRVNKLLNLFYNHLPENGTLSNVIISKQKDNHKIACILPLFKIKDNYFNNNIKIREDSNSPQLLHAKGELNHSEQTMELTLTAATPHTKISVPYLNRQFGTHVAFSSLICSLTKIKHFGSVNLSGLAMVDGLEIYHPALSPDMIHLNRGRLGYQVNIGSNYIELDSASTVQFNELQFNPYLRASKDNKKWHFTISINKSWFPSEDFFASLPQGLFGNLKGIHSNGELAYHFLLDVDFAHLNALKFHSGCRQRNFHILSYGGTNLAKMNGEFMYTAYSNGRPVRTFSIGPSWDHYTPLANISPLLKTAVLQSEDGSFYSHHGFRQETLRNALIYDLQVKRFARGGSTISMQLIKNIFLNKNKNISRKLEEAIIVWLIENKHITSKNRMFEIYLNIAEWGPMVYGIREASEFYFNKLPSELTLEESIFLASIIPKPKHYANSFVVDKTTGEVRLKSYLSSYFRLIAHLMAIRGVISKNEADSIRPAIHLTGKAHNTFLIPKDTTTVVPEEQNIDKEQNTDQELLPF